MSDRPPVGMKRCSKCGETKPLDSFGPRRTESTDGRVSACRTCSAARHRAYYAGHREQAAKRRATYYASNRDREIRYRRERYESDPSAEIEKQKARHAAKQERAVAAAVNNHKEWTGPELELLADTTRTAQELATALGRTYHAIGNMRRLIRTDPRKSKMAGLS